MNTATRTVRIDKETYDAITEAADQRGCFKAKIVKEAVLQYLIGELKRSAKDGLRASRKKESSK